MLSSTDRDILLALFDQELNFRSLCDCGIHQEVLRRHLDTLIRKGYVHEKGRENWTRGKKLLYSLTQEGVEHLSATTVSDLNEVLTRFQKIIARQHEAPAKTRQSYRTAWRQGLVKPIREIEHASEGQNLDEAKEEMLRTASFSDKEIDLESRNVENVFRPLVECYKAVHKTLVEVIQTSLYSEVEDELWKPNEVLVGFTGSLPYFVPVYRLRQEGIISASLQSYE